jgi:hypothetical protein
MNAVTAGANAADAVNTPSAVSLSVTDVSACALSGVTVTFSGGTPSTQYDLYVDTVLTQPNITSGYVYSPGNGSSHAYVVRAVNGTCFTNSNTVNATDANNSTTPTIAGPNANTCPATTVTLSTETGMSNYQWYVGGSPIGGANASTYVVTATGAYTVGYQNASGCTGTSAVHNVTITSCTSAPKPVPDGRLGGVAQHGAKVTADGSNLTLTYDTATCTQADHSILYGLLTALNPITPSGGVCSIGNTSPYAWNGSPAGNIWWVIVGDGGTMESSWGQRMAGGVYSERSAAASNQCGNTTLDVTGTCP